MEEWEVLVEWALWEVSQAQCKCQEELVAQAVQEQVELEEPEEQEQLVEWEEQEQQVAWEEQEVWEACHQEWA